MIKTALLEVTKIEPRYKHSTIFEHFDALEGGESFIIRNDHDPKPLYYQLLGERADVFNWHYLESGPEYWLVQIGKPLSTESVKTIGTVATKDIRKAKLLKQLDVDFSCGGKQSIEEAAYSIGISELKLRNKLEETNNSSSLSMNFDFAAWDLDFLSDYIKNVHHKYIKEKGPLIQRLTENVNIAHATQYPELDKLILGINILMTNLYKNVDEEEKNFFPVTKNSTFQSKEQKKILISNLTNENESVGEQLKQLRVITTNYILPANACHSYTYLFEQIRDFEADLLQYIYLENIKSPKRLDPNFAIFNKTRCTIFYNKLKSL